MIKNVVWKEGLFIRPQHFQQHNFYIMSELTNRTRFTGSNQWGVFQYEIDQAALGLGKIIFKYISGIMPDGTFFEIGDSEELLAMEIKESDTGKSIYLAIPLSIQNSDEIYFEHQEKRPTRYKAKSLHNVPNVNFGEETLSDIVVSEYNFKLLREEELQAGYTFLKLLNIRDVTIDKHISVDSNYEPTFLHLDQAKFIMNGLYDILSTLQYRSENIAERLISDRLDTTELGDYLMLQLINRAYNRLHYFTTQSQLHPADLYLELNSLIGELAVFLKKEKRITKPLAYNHLEQYSSFKSLFTEIKTLLSMVLEKKSLALEMEKGKFGLYRTTISDASMFESNSFILSVSAPYIDEEELKKLLLNNFKVSTVENIRQLVNLHLPGFKVSPLASAPRQIPYRVDNSYFKIVLTHENRQELSRSAGFAFYLPENLQKGLSFTLWAIKDE